MDVGQTGACVRAIDAGFRCRIGNDRMTVMARGTMPAEALIDEVTRRWCEADPEEDPEGIRKEVRQVLTMAEEVRQHWASCAGKSILEMLWERLMEAYGELMQQQELIDDAVAAQGDSEEPLGSLQEAVSEDMELAKRRGVCLGLAEAISIIQNPYAPNVDAVRTECQERYDAMV